MAKDETQARARFYTLSTNELVRNCFKPIKLGSFKYQQGESKEIVTKHGDELENNCASLLTPNHTQPPVPQKLRNQESTRCGASSGHTQKSSSVSNSAHGFHECIQRRKEMVEQVCKLAKQLVEQTTYPKVIFKNEQGFSPLKNIDKKICQVSCNHIDFEHLF